MWTGRNHETWNRNHSGRAKKKKKNTNKIFKQEGTAWREETKSMHPRLLEQSWRMEKNEKCDGAARYKNTRTRKWRRQNKHKSRKTRDCRAVLPSLWRSWIRFKLTLFIQNNKNKCQLAVEVSKVSKCTELFPLDARPPSLKLAPRDFYFIFSKNWISAANDLMENNKTKLASRIDPSWAAAAAEGVDGVTAP